MELDRKIWGFIGDMLEEKEYIESDFLESVPPEQQEEAKVQIQGLAFMGQKFFTSSWVETLLDSLEYSLGCDGDPDVMDVVTRRVHQAAIFNRLHCLEKIFTGGEPIASADESLRAQFVEKAKSLLGAHIHSTTLLHQL